MADNFLPNKTMRKSTSSPACFTDKAQGPSTFSKLGIATTESDSAPSSKTSLTSSSSLASSTRSR
eukprot:455207-Pleurochrysis_carterae.AAC.1